MIKKSRSKISMDGAVRAGFQGSGHNDASVTFSTQVMKTIIMVDCQIPFWG
jgi:hypothetical protein